MSEYITLHKSSVWLWIFSVNLLIPMSYFSFLLSNWWSYYGITPWISLKSWSPITRENRDLIEGGMIWHIFFFTMLSGLFDSLLLPFFGSLHVSFPLQKSLPYLSPICLFPFPLITHPSLHRDIFYQRSHLQSIFVYMPMFCRDALQIWYTQSNIISEIQ
jgi:hypothetical protein